MTSRPKLGLFDPRGNPYDRQRLSPRRTLHKQTRTMVLRTAFIWNIKHIRLNRISFPYLICVDFLPMPPADWAGASIELHHKDRAHTQKHLD
jgi:hypothetical protein